MAWGLKAVQEVGGDGLECLDALGPRHRWATRDPPPAFPGRPRLAGLREGPAFGSCHTLRRASEQAQALWPIGAVAALGVA
jgi:hypothetical protein